MPKGLPVNGQGSGSKRTNDRLRIPYPIPPFGELNSAMHSERYYTDLIELIVSKRARGKRSDGRDQTLGSTPMRRPQDQDR